jgi:hypothetical protein
MQRLIREQETARLTLLLPKKLGKNLAFHHLLNILIWATD